MRPIIKLICPNANCNGHIDRKVDFENKKINGYCRKCNQLAVEAGN
jgi:hypothetical protein